MVACATVSLADDTLRPTNRNYLRSRDSLPRNNEHKRWKTKRKLEGEWEDDDDDIDSAVPFHLQDDDATNDISNNQTQISTEENESETYLERYKEGLNENSDKIKEASEKKEKGIVYSNSTGDKEAEEEQVVHLPPPPPPPVPSTENSTVTEDEEQIMTEQKDTFNEEEPVHNKTSQSQASDDNPDNKQLPTTDESKTPDTIFDDLLRGFTFAASFCALIMCIYKFCGYACVKCGIFPDERVMRARWRRSRLKKKRAYGDSNVVPPLDTRKWAEWSEKRGRVNGGVWDSGFDDIENGAGGSRDDGSEAGAIVFDNSGIEMAEWEDDAGSEMELEFGEGDELEDKSHDERLFDAESEGKSVEEEANKFFDKQSKKNVPKEKSSKKNMKQNGLDKPDSELKSNADEKVEEVDTPALFNASFNELDPPSGENGFVSKPDGGGAVDSSSSAAKEFLLEVSKNGEHHPDLDTHEKVQDDDEQMEEVDNEEEHVRRSSYISDTDRGYDEDADLLGLRSDSPPPLDLEEIEKNLVENMNKAKFY